MIVAPVMAPNLASSSTYIAKLIYRCIYIYYIYIYIYWGLNPCKHFNRGPNFRVHELNLDIIGACI